jgi:hypothetical protein
VQPAQSDVVGQGNEQSHEEDQQDEQSEDDDQSILVVRRGSSRVRDIRENLSSARKQMLDSKYTAAQQSQYQEQSEYGKSLPYSNVLIVPPISLQQNDQTYSTFVPSIRHNIQVRGIADIACLPDASPQHTNDMLQRLANVVVMLDDRLEMLQSARSCQAIETQRGLTNEIEDIFRCAVEKAATYGALCSNNNLLESARIFNGWYKGGSEYPHILSSLYQVDALCTIYPDICKNDVSAQEFAQACSKVSQCWQDMVQQAQIAQGMKPRVSYISRVLCNAIETVRDTVVGAVRIGNRLINNDAHVITTAANSMYISAHNLENKSAMVSSLTDSQLGKLLPITPTEQLIQADLSDDDEKNKPHNLEASVYFAQVQPGSSLSANRTATDLAESFINNALTDE